MRVLPGAAYPGAYPEPILRPASSGVWGWAMTQLRLGIDPPVEPMRFHCGYAFGLRELCRPLHPWIHAVVATPRWADRAASLRWPVMLDNGAFPAWRDGRDLSMSEQFEGVLSAAERIEDVHSLIACDVVADGAESWRRTQESAPAFAQRAFVWVPVQEGSPVPECVALALEVGGVFVGGADFRFKIRTARAIRDMDPDVPIHVARISQEDHLFACAQAGATSFDNTTFTRLGLRSQGRRVGDYVDRLTRYARRVR